MIGNDYILSVPKLRTSGRIIRLSTDSQPTVGDDGGTLQVGTELLIEDTGLTYYWSGSAWERPNLAQKIDQLVELQLEIRDFLQKVIYPD